MERDRNQDTSLEDITRRRRRRLRDTGLVVFLIVWPFVVALSHARVYMALLSIVLYGGVAVLTGLYFTVICAVGGAIVAAMQGPAVNGDDPARKALRMLAGGVLGVLFGWMVDCLQRLDSSK